MGTVVILRGDDGRLAGLGEKGARAYAAWRRMVEELPIGQTLEFSYRLPRSPGFHRLFFRMLDALFSSQERFEDIDQLRVWLTMGAGYCIYVPGINGGLCAIPKSIKWSAMDDSEFRPLVASVWRFLRGGHAQSVLWPHLADGQAAEGVEQFLIGFED